MLPLEPIKKREQAATRGPWQFDSFGDWSIHTPIDPSGCYSVIVAGEGDSDVVYDEVSPIGQACNGEFIAHAREDVPALIDEVERLREVLGKCHDYFNGKRRDELPQIIVECKRALGR